MKKIAMAGGQLFLCIVTIMVILIVTASRSHAADITSRHGSEDAARATCQAAAAGYINSTRSNRDPCEFKSGYAWREMYFSFCTYEDKRLSGCGSLTDRHIFVYPIPFQETITSNIYQTSSDAHQACTAYFVSVFGSPNVRCGGMGIWKDEQGNSIGYTSGITGYILHNHPQTTPSWGGYSCSNLYNWHSTLEWCNQTNFRAYFGGCPAGTEPDPANFNKCEHVPDDPFKRNGRPCNTGSTQAGSRQSASSVGNPCHAGTGNKYQAETDFKGALGLVRSYNSQGQRDVGFGMGWTSNLHKTLSVFGNTLLVHEADGRSERWTRDAGSWRGDADSRLLLAETPSGFMLTRQNGDRENYNPSGRLLAEIDTNDNRTDYLYDANTVD